MLRYIANTDHYQEVIRKATQVKNHLWIGTADIKDLYVEAPMNRTQPFLAEIQNLLQKRVAVRLLCAKTPGENFMRDFKKYPLLQRDLELVQCPREHFKLFIFDFKEVYIGSANLTGAGLGIKGANNRNFEAGILSDEPALVTQAIDQFDGVWNGSWCKACNRKAYCEKPIDQL